MPAILRPRQNKTDLDSVSVLNYLNEGRQFFRFCLIKCYSLYFNSFFLSSYNVHICAFMFIKC